MPLYSTACPLPINRKISRRKGSTPAPSGIVVATTNTINVVDVFNIGQTISLTKLDSNEYRTEAYSFNISQIYCEAYSDNVNITVFRVSVILEGGYWIYRYYGIYECGGDNFGQNYDISSVLEVTSGIIPTTGWDPALTITAA